MEFKVRAASIFECDRTKPPTKILAKYPCLKEFGYEIRQIYRAKTSRIQDETGKFMQQVNYFTEYEEYVTINSLEQLLELRKAVDEELIIDADSILIYDDYVE